MIECFKHLLIPAVVSSWWEWVFVDLCVYEELAVCLSASLCVYVCECVSVCVGMVLLEVSADGRRGRAYSTNFTQVHTLQNKWQVPSEHTRHKKHIFTHTFTHTFTHRHTHSDTHIQTHTHTHSDTHTFTHTHTHSDTHTNKRGRKLRASVSTCTVDKGY